MRWTPQEYIQSQCKGAIRCDFTSGAVNLTIHVLRIKQCGVHFLFFFFFLVFTLEFWREKKLKFSGNIHDAVSWQPISAEIILTSLMVQTLPAFAEWTWNQTWPKQIRIWIYRQYGTDRLIWYHSQLLTVKTQVIACRTKPNCTVWWKLDFRQR